jgi:hypothetical protein
MERGWGLGDGLAVATAELLAHMLDHLPLAGTTTPSATGRGLSCFFRHQHQRSCPLPLRGHDDRVTPLSPLSGNQPPLVQAVLGGGIRSKSPSPESHHAAAFADFQLPTSACSEHGAQSDVAEPPVLMHNSRRLLTMICNCGIGWVRTRRFHLFWSLIRASGRRVTSCRSELFRWT